MVSKESLLGGLFAILVCLMKTALTIFTPLYLDCLTPYNSIYLNISKNDTNGSATDYFPATPAWQTIDPFFGIWFSMGWDTLVLGIVVFVLRFCTGSITERETKYPKKILVLSGSFQAVSSLLYQFSSSGSRTAPYLQGALGYLYIPIAFILRYFILRIRPTKLKITCAATIVLAEFVSLIPTIFPYLENSAEKQEDHGASGIGSILWPMCFVANGIPHALWGILLEKSAKAENSKQNDDFHRLNMAYVMFWNFFGTFVTTVVVFWVDLIPGFGLMADIKLFPQQFVFNMACIFGATPVCGFYQVFVTWGRIITKTCFFVLVGLLMRYGEGANLYAILSAIVYPLVFLFFTLFDEQPFRWHPHATLSTWFSIGVLVVMIPAVVIYNMGAKETNLLDTQHNADNLRTVDEGDMATNDRAQLLTQEDQTVNH